MIYLNLSLVAGVFLRKPVCEVKWIRNIEEEVSIVFMYYGPLIDYRIGV
jgi:hypothetical protein